MRSLAPIPPVCKVEIPKKDVKIVSRNDWRLPSRLRSHSHAGRERSWLGWRATPAAFKIEARATCISNLMANAGTPVSEHEQQDGTMACLHTCPSAVAQGVLRATSSSGHMLLGTPHCCTLSCSATCQDCLRARNTRQNQSGMQVNFALCSSLSQASAAA